MNEDDIKRIICKMIEDGDIRLNVKYDSYEHELDFEIEVSYPDSNEVDMINEVLVKQETVRL